MDAPRQQRRPTVAQVYALAAALCGLHELPFPATRTEASEVIERLRRALGHPEPALGDAPPRDRPSAGRRERSRA